TFFFTYDAGPHDLPSFPTRRASDLAAQALESYWADDTFERHTRRKERLVRDWLENLVHSYPMADLSVRGRGLIQGLVMSGKDDRSEEHTSELQSRENLVCRLLLEKK